MLLRIAFAKKTSRLTALAVAAALALAPVAPALAQALFHATGRRLDVMPFPQDAFRAKD